MKQIEITRLKEILALIRLPYKGRHELGMIVNAIRAYGIGQYDFGTYRFTCLRHSGLYDFVASLPREGGKQFQALEQLPKNLHEANDKQIQYVMEDYALQMRVLQLRFKTLGDITWC